MTRAPVWVTTRNGRRLHTEHHRSLGARERPLVVFESGLGTSRWMWGAVAPLVAAVATCVTYDRGGLGQSPPDDRPRHLGRLADDLVDVLASLGDVPCVLVGHSWGGPIVRSAAALAPERVAGLVLVNQTDEHCALFFSKSNERQTRWMKPFMPVLSRLGVIGMGVKRLAAWLPEPDRSGMIAEDGSIAAVRAQQAELASYIDDLRRLRGSPPVLPEVPMSVISGAMISRSERKRRPALIEAHRATAAAHPGGRHVLAERSGHSVPFTEPELVADEIRSMLVG